MSNDKKEKKQDPMEVAVRYLEHRARTRLEVEKRLKEKEFSQEEIDEVLSRLVSLHYVDDREYARQYILYASEKRRGALRIEKELSDKGISREVLKQAYFDLEDEGMDREETEWQNALTEAKNLASGKEYDAKLEGKIGRRLSSLGYSGSVIYRALAEVRKGEEG